MKRAILLTAALVCGFGVTTQTRADQQAAIDGCIDRLREVGGPDARAGGEVLSKQWSQAGTLVRLQDAGGTIWECIGYDDGAVGDLRVVEAMDDGEGAMDGAPSMSGPVDVHFQPGTTGATYDGTLAPGDAIQYVLDARKNQFLDVQVRPQGAEMDYQIMNPDGSQLLDMIGSDKPYEGQLWQSGNHVVEIINRNNTPASYMVEFSIR